MADMPTGITAIFRRVDMFYPVQFMGMKPPSEEAADHAALNPGTVRIEDTLGNVLWPPAAVEGNDDVVADGST